MVPQRDDPRAGALGIGPAAGLIAGILEGAGLRDVTEKVISGTRNYDSADYYWTMMMEVAAPVVAAMSKTDEPTRARIKADVFATLKQPGGRVSLNFGARVISGTK